MLEIGNSAYAVNPHGDALQMRVEPSVQQQVVDAVANAVGSAGDHLASAWNHSYGRKHDAPKAYSEAIKAIEAAAAPIVSPKNAKATLGTMIADVRQKPGKWLLEVAVPDGMTTVADMMDLIWKGQTSRHGGLAPTREETPDEAQTAVHL
ncbi:MAG: hypothetical protein JWP66_971, partial [Naasia sp.]|nr:hypothetical protein [Naasia sp.]